MFSTSLSKIRNKSNGFVRHSIWCGGSVAQNSTDSSLKREHRLIRSEDYHMLTHTHTLTLTTQAVAPVRMETLLRGISWMNCSPALFDAASQSQTCYRSPSAHCRPASGLRQAAVPPLIYLHDLLGTGAREWGPLLGHANPVIHS